MYKVSRSNSNGKFTFKNSSFCCIKVILTAWRHYDVMLTSHDHVHLISCVVFIKSTKFQDRTLMGSLLLKIARFVVMKAILTAWRHNDVMTSFWRPQDHGCCDIAISKSAFYLSQLEDYMLTLRALAFVRWRWQPLALHTDLCHKRTSNPSTQLTAGKCASMQALQPEHGRVSLACGAPHSQTNRRR